MNRIIVLLLAISFSNGTLAFNFDSDLNPFAVIKYRQDFMQAVKVHNNSIKVIVNDVVPFDQHLDMHVNALELLFAEIGSLFPEGSNFGETNAKDTIWENPDKFNQTLLKSQQALQDFKRALENSDPAARRTAFKKFGSSSCGSCHKSFKKKQN